MRKLIFLCFAMISLNGVAQFTVINANPSGVGSLSEAITKAEEFNDLSTITFNITSGSAPYIITLPSLPAIWNPLSIDGGTVAAGQEPKIHIKCPNASIATFTFMSPGNTVKNITFSDAPSGIHFWNHVNTPGSANLVQNNVFYNMTGPAIWFYYSYNSQFLGNYFGTNRAKTLVAPVRNAIQSFNNTGSDYGNIVGGTGTDRNYFYNSTSIALNFWGGGNNKVTNNIFVNNKMNFHIGYYGNASPAWMADDNASGSYCSNCANNGKHSPVITQVVLNGPGTQITIAGTTSAPSDVIEIYKSNSTATTYSAVGREASIYVGTATAGADSKWTLTRVNNNPVLAVGDVLVAIARDAQGNTSQFGKMSDPVSNPCLSNCPNGLSFSYSPSPIVINAQTQQSPTITFTNTSACTGGSFSSITWEIRHPATNTTTTLSGSPATTTFTKKGFYIVRLITTYAGNSCSTVKAFSVGEELTCENCIGSFAPEAGKYILSAWVKESGATASTLTYGLPNGSPEIKIYFPTNPNDPATYGTPTIFNPEGDIIDGWQRIEKEFTIQPATNYIVVELNSKTVDCFFDDIRVFPKNAAMTSYVYDPITLKLVAELDERNYATFYNYDEEGKMLRVKKETEKGIMTLEENRTNNVKK